MNKQIEEMAKHCPCYDEGKCYYDGETPEKCDILCQYGTYAEILYNAGYRKQSEGKWKTVSEKSPRYVCTACNHLFNNKEYRFCPHCGAKMKGGVK